MVKKYAKGVSQKLGQYFDLNEFHCSCSRCSETFVDELLIDKLDKVRAEFGKPLKITSGYRCPEHNASSGGKSNSAHTSGMAADIRPVNNMSVEELDRLYEICLKHFDNIGNGINKGFIHVDSRPLKADGKKRLWMY